MSTPSEPTVDHKDDLAERSISLQDLNNLLKEARKVTPTPDDQRLSWSGLLEIAVKVVPIAGILMYSVLSLAYSRFYDPLSVRPSDVGLGYVDTLANSVGAVLTFLLLIGLGSALLFAGTFLVLFAINLTIVIRSLNLGSPRPSIHDETGEFASTMLIASVAASIIRAVSDLLERLRNIRKVTVKFTLWGSAAIAFVLVAYALPQVATNRAEDVKAGHSVTPPRTPLLHLSFLQIRADPATIEPSGETGKTPAIDRLVTRPVGWPSLLYLGQTRGIVVLYDSQLRQIAYVSASSILLRVDNCESKPRPVKCQGP